MESLTFLKPHYLCFRMLLSKVKNNAIKHFEAVISSLAFGMSKQPLHESDMEFRLCRLWNKHFCFDLWVSMDFLRTARIDIALLCAYFHITFAQKFTHSIFLTKVISFHAEFRRKWECNGILNSNWRKNIWTSSRVLNRGASQGMPKRNDVDIGGIMVACIFEQDFCLIPGILTIL